MNCENIDRVLRIFEEISKIPHGSGNMKLISQYCVDFANKNNFKFVKDESCNVVIFKDATNGYEDKEPIILQGHLDMVCQKTVECEIDFETDGLEIYKDGDFLKAKDTTLGADNGIAVAMVLSILERNDISHPKIIAVFTTDEEIGMLGADALDMSIIDSKRMINLDTEEENSVTVSCAGGSDFKAVIPYITKVKKGIQVKVTLKGLKGGHSGVEIDKGRINANILAGKFLNEFDKINDFEIISINGGNKANAIPNLCEILLCCDKKENLNQELTTVLEKIKTEISKIEEGFEFETVVGDFGEYEVFYDKKILKFVLENTPDGIIKMSEDIEGLVETSLNLGILKTENNEFVFQYALRSNKAVSLNLLGEEMQNFFSKVTEIYEISGYYPPWEYRENSPLRELYSKVYTDTLGENPCIEAIHAGLECAVFSKKIKDLDCIAVGPSIFDAHTVNERLSISSTKKIYSLIIKVLELL